VLKKKTLKLKRPRERERERERVENNCKRKDATWTYLHNACSLKFVKEFSILPLLFNPLRKKRKCMPVRVSYDIHNLTELPRHISKMQGSNKRRYLLGRLVVQVPENSHFPNPPPLLQNRCCCRCLCCCSCFSCCRYGTKATHPQTEGRSWTGVRKKLRDQGFAEDKSSTTHLLPAEANRARSSARAHERERERAQAREGAALKSIRLPELGFRVLGFMTYPKIFFFLPQHTQNGYNVLSK